MSQAAAGNDAVGVAFEDAAPAERSEVTETLHAGQAEALAGLLDLPADVLATGDLPPLWHWTHLLPRPATAVIGPDGHPSTGVPAPPGEGMRRMFAGGRVRTHGLLRIGREATRRTWVTGRREKQGRSGPLTFVSVRTEVSQDGRVVVVEDNDIVYRAATDGPPLPAASLDQQPPMVSDGPVLRFRADEPALFRFSALTYNAHRIHYDLGWCAVEGYEGLVVHGPLQALLMGELVRRDGAGLVGQEFAYRLVAPAVGTQVVTVLPGEAGLAQGARVLDASGRTTAECMLRPLTAAGA